MKCPQCKTQENDRASRPLSFAFRGGKTVYACSRHKSTVPKDPITDWLRLPALKKEKGDADVEPRLH